MAAARRAERSLVKGAVIVKKKIYILLSCSETVVSKCIGVFTAEPYTHASIAFDSGLSPLYSFARLGKYPLPGGFRLEFTDSGYYKEHSGIRCAVYSLETDEQSFELAQRLVEKMRRSPALYRYNVLGLALCKLNIAWRREHYYFCSEFVSFVLSTANCMELPKNPSLMRPCDFMRLPELKPEFEGTMHELAQRCRLNRQMLAEA